MLIILNSVLTVSGWHLILNSFLMILSGLLRGLGDFLTVFGNASWIIVGESRMVKNCQEVKFLAIWHTSCSNSYSGTGPSARPHWTAIITIPLPTCTWKWHKMAFDIQFWKQCCSVKHDWMNFNYVSFESILIILHEINMIIVTHPTTFVHCFRVLGFFWDTL